MSNPDYFAEAIASAVRLVVSGDGDVWLVVWTSTSISITASLAATLIGVPLGLATALGRFPGKALLRQTLNALMAVPTVVVGLFLYGLLSRRGVFGDLGLLYTPVAIVIGQAVLIIPIIWNLTITAIDSTDPRLALTCRSLGATRVQQALLFLDEARFAIGAAVVMGFGRAIGEVGVAMMLGGNIEGFTRTMTTAIALETSRGEFELAMALGLVLLLVAFTVNAALGRLQRLAR